MNSRNIYKNTRCSYSRPRRHDGDLKVMNGLAVTPSDMMRLARQGVPISTENVQNFYDGDDNPSWTIAPEKLKHMDPADLWAMSITSKQKIRKAKRINQD